MTYLYKFGLNDTDILEIKDSVSNDTYAELTFLEKIVTANVQFLIDFGITNYKDVITRYPEIFLRDEESFKNVFSKFDRDDLINKVTKNVAVIKKMVDFIDNN